MTMSADFSWLCESFFAKRLMAQRNASQHTISSYAHTFRLLIKFAQKRLGTPPSKLTLPELNAPFLVEFLDDLEATRGNDARSRNARLAALRSFYHYAALEAPQHSECRRGSESVSFVVEETSYSPCASSHSGHGIAAGRRRSLVDRHLAWTRIPRHNANLLGCKPHNEGANPG